MTCWLEDLWSSHQTPELILKGRNGRTAQAKKKKKSICKVLCLLGKKLNSLQAILVDGKNSAETEKQILFL